MKIIVDSPKACNYFKATFISKSVRLKEILMQTTRVLIAIVLCVLSAKMADATILFTTVVTPGGSQLNTSPQSFSIKLGMVGNNSTTDRVNSFSFTARLSLSAADLVSSGGNTIFTPDVVNGPPNQAWYAEFTHSPDANPPGVDGVSGFNSNQINFSGLFGNNVNFNDVSFADRFRTINFTTRAGIAPQDITLSIISPVFTGTDANGNAVLVPVTSNLTLAGGSITAVPEPGSISLIVLGGVGGIYARWRSKKKKINTESLAQ